MVTTALAPKVPAFIAGDPDGSGRTPRVLQDRVTGAVLGAFFAVHRELGGGFLPEVYLKALSLEFAHRSIAAERDVPLGVYYKGTRVGHYRAPFVIAGRVVVMVHATNRIDVADEQATGNVLRASGTPSALLLNFGVAASFRHFEM